MKFKLLAAVLVVIPILLAGYWWLAASTHKAAIEAWLAERRAAGWQAEVSDVAVNGFPNRLDLRLDAPALADPASGWAWSAARLDILQVIYDPTFFVVEWPAEQQIAAPGARAVLRSASMRTSLKLATSSALTLRRASFDIKDAAVAAEAGWTAGAERLTAHLREAPDAGPENTFEFRLDATRLRPPAFLRQMADPAGALPPEVEVIAAEGRAVFDRPLDRHALEGVKPNLSLISLKGVEARWGRLALSVSGRLKADAAGYAEGTLDISATHWEEMLDAAVAAGAVAQSVAETMKIGLGFIARLSGDEDRLNVGLVLKGGQMRIGPLPIGPAPRFVR